VFIYSFDNAKGEEHDHFTILAACLVPTTGGGLHIPATKRSEA
jgi:hypothetical protein